MVRFARTTNALDQLADALRRADAAWRAAEVVEWQRLTKEEHEEWRAVARTAAMEVVEEITAHGRQPGIG